MKYSSALVAATTMLPVVALATPFADGRSQGMAGVGIAAGDFRQTLANPALLTRFADDDSFYLQLGLGALGREYDDTIDGVDATQDDIAAFEAALAQGDRVAAMEIALRAGERLQALEQNSPGGELELLLGGYRPSQSLAWGVSLSGYAAVSGVVDYVESDEQLLREALITLQFNPDEIASNADLQGAFVSELTLSLARQFTLNELPLSVGIAPKLQRIDSYYYNANISNFDDDDLTDNRNMTDTTEFNLDVGFHSGYGAWQWALVIRNLLEQELTDVTGQSLMLRPTAVAGLGWQAHGLTIEVDLDLNEDDSFETYIMPSQWARIGAEYDFRQWLQARLGFRSDLSDNYHDIWSFGLGFSPGQMVSLDLAAQLGDNDELGGQIQLGLRF
ncbi:conjugal transfer protein TraF [Ferrimonas senticii]|uniref:conjugal transfer protein TraF n=1 Tax=Ferrimonas senticii TaxID=394566 RepID=UPI0004157988|nr:conjugal transfer protein TraF [Ferrimonas senticii]